MLWWMETMWCFEPYLHSRHSSHYLFSASILVFFVCRTLPSTASAKTDFSYFNSTLLFIFSNILQFLCYLFCHFFCDNFYFVNKQLEFNYFVFNAFFIAFGLNATIYEILCKSYFLCFIVFNFRLKTNF